MTVEVKVEELPLIKGIKGEQGPFSDLGDTEIVWYGWDIEPKPERIDDGDSS